MKQLKRSALAWSLMAVLTLPGIVLAEEAPKLEAAPATESTPAPMEDMQAMRERMQDKDMMQSQGIGPGNRCNKRPGMGSGMMGMGSGMMGMGSGMMGMGAGMGMNCDRKGGGHGDCDVSKRLEDLEKRMDMMQMMMKMMMSR